MNSAGRLCDCRKKAIAVLVIAALASVAAIAPQRDAGGMPMPVSLWCGYYITYGENVTYAGADVPVGGLCELVENATGSVIFTFYMGNGTVGPGGARAGHFDVTPNIDTADMPIQAFVRAYDAPTKGNATAEGRSAVFTISGSGPYQLSGWELDGYPAALSITYAPSSVTTNLPFSVNVTALDANGNVARTYNGTVQITSSDPLASLPGQHPFVLADAGLHAFGGIVLRTDGSQTINVTDAAQPAMTDEATVLAVDTAPPGRPSGLTASDAGGSVRLDWLSPPDLDVAHYLIYRSTDPSMFDLYNPHHNTSGDAQPIATNWTDEAVPAGMNMYYAARAVDDAGLESNLSNAAGRFHLALAAEWNLVSFSLSPANRSLDANLGALTGGLYQSESDRVLSWDSSAGRWLVAWKFEAGGPSDRWYFTSDTFEIEPGVGYWIQVKPGHPQPVLANHGRCPSGASGFPVEVGWNLVGWNSLESVPVGNDVPDGTGLGESGFTWGEMQSESDRLLWYNGSGWLVAWMYNGTTFPASCGNWFGESFALAPGLGYWLEVRAGHSAFTWVYGPQPLADVDVTPLGIQQSNWGKYGVTISWVTTANVTGWVEYGLTPALGSVYADVRGSGHVGTTHYVKLIGFDTGTKCYFKICSGGTIFGDDGGGGASPAGTPWNFTTLETVGGGAPSAHGLNGHVEDASGQNASGAMAYMYLTRAASTSRLSSYLVGEDGYFDFQLSGLRDLVGNRYYWQNGDVIHLRFDGGYLGKYPSSGWDTTLTVNSLVIEQDLGTFTLG